ncbi:MAG: NAD-dependent epimerase/dehydratase family protein [Alphaproteobacteria bacterium]|nr:NAD-dependent epimerase/dehydratase family protein [Alphaproteobacteria bacterium]
MKIRHPARSVAPQNGNIDRKTLLITGAAGSVGTALRPLLRRDFALVLLDTNDLGPLAANERAIKASITDAGAVENAVQDADAILHLAAVHDFDISFEQTLDVNYRGMILLLDAAVRHGVESVIFASSNHGWGYYKVADTPLSDRDPPRPDGWYGIAKLWGEATLTFYAETYGFSATSLRIGNLNDTVPDQHRIHMWLSYADMARLVGTIIDRHLPGHRAFFCNSNGPKPFFENSGFDQLGFIPRDTPMDHLSDPNLATSPDISPDNDLGGGFARLNRQLGKK